MVKKGEKPPRSDANPASVDPETQQKQRLRSLAVSKRLLRRSPAVPSAPLAPSKAVLKLEGRDVVKRGQRKSRFLFSFPGLIAPLSGGRVGELTDLSTKNPVLYLDFPNGRMKLFGTHVYPKNKYLTLQLTKSAKGVMCEDCFESLIVFSEAWWIGSKEENPEECQLEFPKDINENKLADPDFKGGAGATSEEATCLKRPTKEYKEKSPSLDTESEEDVDEDSYPLTGKNVKSMLAATPVRHSARTVGKKLSYAESSGNDSTPSDGEEPEREEPEKEDQDDVRTDNDNASRRSLLSELEDFIPATSSLLAPGSELVDKKKKEQSSSLKKLKQPKENSPSKKGSLVQATLSTLFEKAVEKKSKRSASDSPGPKGSGAKRQRVDSNQITKQVEVKGSKKKEACSSGNKSRTKTVSVKKKSQVMDDETEEISSDSQDDSDEDWAA